MIIILENIIHPLRCGILHEGLFMIITDWCLADRELNTNSLLNTQDVNKYMPFLKCNNSLSMSMLFIYHVYFIIWICTTCLESICLFGEEAGEVTMTSPVQCGWLSMLKLGYSYKTRDEVRNRMAGAVLIPYGHADTAPATMTTAWPIYLPTLLEVALIMWLVSSLPV